MRALLHPYVRRVGLLTLVSGGLPDLRRLHLQERGRGARGAVRTRHVLRQRRARLQRALAALSARARAILAQALRSRCRAVVLPALLATGGLGLLAGLSLSLACSSRLRRRAALLTHRTATELLFVPLPDRARPRIKAALDVAAQPQGRRWRRCCSSRSPRPRCRPKPWRCCCRARRRMARGRTRPAPPLRGAAAAGARRVEGIRCGVAGARSSRRSRR